MEGGPELEGEREDVDPCYLADGDGVGDGEGSVKDAFGAGEDFVHGGQVGHDHALMRAVAEGVVPDDDLDVGGQVGQDLEGEVAEVFLGALDQFPRVRCGKTQAEIFACFFPFGHFSHREGVGVVGIPGEGGEVGD